MLEIRIPGRFVSSRHAEIRRSNGIWTLQDAGSTNGTFVNGQRIQSVELADGDLIEVGHTYLKLALATPAPECIESDPGERAPAALTTLLPWLEAAFRRLQTAARTPLTINIVGATGTGKELMARAVHALSRRSGELVAVNCGALAPTLVHSLLFGHVRGAYSGAVRDERGFIRAADRGTLFLDEIEELPLDVQAMLLRVIQESEVVPVGSSQAVRVDVRVIVAGQTPLPRLVEQRKFRADLHARLQGFSLHLPSLAERREDFGVLVCALLTKVGGQSFTFSRQAGYALLSHGWPQNIRELEQTLRHACSLAENSHVRTRDLPSSIVQPPTDGAPREATNGPALRLDPESLPGGIAAPQLSDADRALRVRLVALFAEYEGNVSAVARAMGKTRTQVHRWTQRLGLRIDAFR